MAVGDSFAEGLNDATAGFPQAGPPAGRPAQGEYARLRYANPAVQGKLLRQVVAAQVSAAAALSPGAPARQVCRGGPPRQLALVTAFGVTIADLMPGDWHARMLVLLSRIERGRPGGFGAAQDFAVRAVTAADTAADPYATADALVNLWLTDSVSRDHVAALGHIDRTLHVLGNDPGQADMRLIALDARTFSLQNVDQWPQAEAALQEAAAGRGATGEPGITVPAARPQPFNLCKSRGDAAERLGALFGVGDDDGLADEGVLHG